MPIKVTMPALSPTMEEGTLAKWLKKEGDTVEAGDVIAEIETDKATMEVEAVDEGVLAKIIVSEGTEGVPVNELIAVLLEEGESEDDLASFIQGGNDNAVAMPVSAAPSAVPQTKAASKPVALTPPPQAQNGTRIFASPLAKRLAEQDNIDLTAITGTGPRGRIVKADIEAAKAGGAPAKVPAAAQQKAVSSAAVSMPQGPDAKALADMLGMEYEEIPNNKIRKITAQRLQESKQTVPHFYLTIECRIDNLLKARKQINEEANGAYKLSVNDFIVKACANALKAYPAANTAWTDDAILQYKHADISVAVATPDGLITPIVKHAENKGLRQISEEVKDLAVRAREGKLKPEEFQGGTFTVSNLGMFGIQEFGAIINPPQACILAVGAGEQKPYVDGGEIKVGTFIKATLSVDHRAVDGAVGAEYLKILKQYIENPLSMLL